MVAGAVAVGEIGVPAQVVEPLCLTCHGAELAETVSAILTDFYPDDWATGYLPGQVRGAISLSKQLPARDENGQESVR